MTEYIEREKVHELVRSLNRYAWKSPDKSMCRVTLDVDDVQFGVDKIPTADVVEVRHGRWIDCSNGWMCSECEQDNTYDKPYCPNCGAKMDGKDDDDK